MISGLQKMTLLDFPGRVACTVFLKGCNYRCPFCHNSELFLGKPETLMENEEFFRFLERRKGLLDGVCVSGGEPTLHPGLPEFLRRIKSLGYAVKLDTNGTRPEMLKRLAGEGLLDHVAMDIKNSPSRYAQTVGLESVDLGPLEETLRFFMAGGVSYELRTTLVAQLHDEASVEEMGKWLAGIVPGKRPRKLYLQSFVDRDTVVYAGLTAPKPESVAIYKKILLSYVEDVSIRGE